MTHIITTMICLFVATISLQGVIDGSTFSIVSLAICSMCAGACASFGIANFRS